MNVYIRNGKTFQEIEIHLSFKHLLLNMVVLHIHFHIILSDSPHYLVWKNGQQKIMKVLEMLHFQYNHNHVNIHVVLKTLLLLIYNHHEDLQRRLK